MKRSKNIKVQHKLTTPIETKRSNETTRDKDNFAENQQKENNTNNKCRTEKPNAEEEIRRRKMFGKRENRKSKEENGRKITGNKQGQTKVNKKNQRGKSVKEH